ncbi:glycoside hydrolase family 13 protein [Peniophora sp. CONT]|nr:glycoside hydrolase family 13 protein [Peniophora sp. CONT]
MRSTSRLPVLVAAATLVSASSFDAHHHRSPHNARHTLKSRALQCRAAGPKATIVQMFQWSWDSIASECTNFLGPAGYGYVQTSPPQETITGGQWWVDYQAVSYKLQNNHGNRDSYKNMIDTCHAAGVKVIVDTVINHMAGIDSGTGTAGTSFTHYTYDGYYQAQDFHYCGLEPGNAIVNYNSATEVQTCQLSNLADLDTGAEYPRSRLAEYVNDLLSLGVDGLRIDAAKHISVTDLANITSRLNGSPYITQEVVAGGAVTPQMYVDLGNVQEFRYAEELKKAFSSSGISELQDLSTFGWVGASDANVFVANHDTERGGNTLNANSPSNTYVLATVFSLAHPYGTPTILSSYSFSNSDDGAPNGGAGTCSGNGGQNGWLCQHRWAATSGMVKWRNAVGTAALNNWVAPSSNQIAFGRGSVGFVAINNQDSQWSTSFKTSLPDGSYCDVVHETNAKGPCTGTTYTVSGGSFSATIAAREALAIYVAA